MTADQIQKLSNDNLIKSLEDRFAIERRVTNEILLHILEINRRRLYADRGYSSLFEMLIKHFKQSENATNQRLKVVNLYNAVPKVEEKLINGEVNLSTLAMAQSQ